jgi:hypothetical protein
MSLSRHLREELAAMTRGPLIFLAIVSAATLELMAAPQTTTRAATAPVAPTVLSQQVLGKAVPAGGWSESATVTVSMDAVGTGEQLHAEVEFSLAGGTFTPVLSGEGPAVGIPSGDTAILTASVGGLANDESYVWRARITDAEGDSSPWVSFPSSGTVAIKTDFTPPLTPEVSSGGGLQPGGWTRAASLTFSWTSSDPVSGVAGYVLKLSPTPLAKPPSSPLTQESGTTITPLPEGSWTFQVWAQDNAGNWSLPGDFTFTVERTAASVQFESVTNLAVRALPFNPYFGPDVWRLYLQHTASVMAQTQSIHGWTTGWDTLGVLQPGWHEYHWKGIGARGRALPRGRYRIRVRTEDPAGNAGQYESKWVPIAYAYPETGRHILVSVSHQAIYAFDGASPVDSSLATTGNPITPTPIGHFSINARVKPCTLTSSGWSDGKHSYGPYTLHAHYCLDFIRSTYIIHDAPWRTLFGPASNGPGWPPGKNHTGSHGCVDVPLTFEQFLWNWSRIGTAVDVVGSLSPAR